MPTSTCEVCGEVQTAERWHHNFVCNGCQAKLHSDANAFDQWEAERLRRLFDQYEIAPGSGGDAQAAIDTLQNAIGRQVACEAPFESENWWFIPENAIGSWGYIVDKRDGNIKVLGSAYHLGQHFLYYEFGFRFDLMDMRITQVSAFEQSVDFLFRQSLWKNPRHEVFPESCPSNGPVAAEAHETAKIKHWNRDEIQAALTKLPFCFRSQRLNPQPFLDARDGLPFEYEVSHGT